MSHELVGLRAEDLEPSEVEELEGLLSSDEEARKDHAFARQIEHLLVDDEDRGPSVDALRARAASRGWGPVTGVALAVAASGMLFLGLQGDDGVRDRGVGAVLAVELTAVAEGPEGVRNLRSGGRVSAAEQVVFWVKASGEGTLTLTEDGSTQVYPLGAAVWRARTGEQVLGGVQPLAYRPDTAGPHRYTVELCDPEARCVKHELGLEWLP